MVAQVWSTGHTLQPLHKGKSLAQQAIEIGKVFEGMLKRIIAACWYAMTGDRDASAD